MPLKYTVTTNGWAPGVYLGKATIAEIADRSGEDDGFGNTPDLMIDVKLEIGRDFQPIMTLKGDLEYDEVTHEAVGFGRAAVIGEFFQALGVQLELNASNRLQQNQIQVVIGRQIWRLQYVSGVKKETGKVKYSNYPYVLPAEADPKKLFERFERGIKRDKPYPSNYHPELITHDIPERVVPLPQGSPLF